MGAIAPILRHFTFGMPLLPSAFAMCLEPLTYGLVSSAAMALIMVGKYTWRAFFAANFVNAVPGILLQTILLPILVMVVIKANIVKE